MSLAHPEQGTAILVMAFNPRIYFLELLNVSLEHFDFLLQRLVVLANLVDAFFILVALPDPGEAFLALHALLRNFRACLEVLL